MTRTIKNNILPEEHEYLLSNAQISQLIAQEIVKRTDTGPWEVSSHGNHICSDDFTHDVCLKVAGDFYDDGQRLVYATLIAARLNTAANESMDLNTRRLNKLLELLCTDSMNSLYQAFEQSPFEGAYPTKLEMLAALDKSLLPPTK